MSLTARPEITDKSRRVSAIDRLRTANVRLPTFRKMAKPETVAANTETSLKAVDPDAADARNLWRVHWFNDATRKSRIAVRGHIVLPELLTGVQSPIVVLLGQRFPNFGAHKVLAAYACLVPRLVTGQFDPAHDRTIWPSTTGNYCRGSVAISRILGCRGVAVLPGGYQQR
jgi:cysteine synthase